MQGLSRGLVNTIRHNVMNKPVVETTNELNIELDASTLASVTFVKINENTYDLVHTLIPEQLQGQGLGKLFAKRIFNHLLSQQKQIKLSCEFLQHFYSINKTSYEGHILEDFKLT